MAKRCLAFLFLLLPLWASAQEDVLRDKSGEWRILVADLICPDARSAESSYICDALGENMVRHFSAFGTHVMNERETGILRNHIKEEYVLKCRKELAANYKKLDALMFSSDSSGKDAILSSIRKSRKKLKKGENYRLEKIFVEKEKEIVLVNGDTKNTALKSPAELYTRAVNDKLDYIIWGTAGVVDRVVAAEISLYSRPEKRNICSVRISGDADTVFGNLERELDSFTSHILGKEWARISLKLNSEDADIYVDGEYMATGSTAGIIVDPGEHTVTVSGAGTDTALERVNLGNGETAVLDMAVNKVAGRQVTVTSEPPGADVYLGSVWQGKTPLILEADAGEVLVTGEGFGDSRLFLEDTDEDKLEFFLQKELFDRDEYLLEKRNAFYRNFSYFVLSVPVAFFSYAAYQSYDDLEKRSAVSGSSHEHRKNSRTRNYSRNIYYGSLFLSVTLFINSMFYLRDYIRAGEAYNVDRS